MLAKAAYGDTDFGEVGYAPANDVARLVSALVHKYGLDPIDRSVRLGWPRRKIDRPEMDRLVVTALAVRNEQGVVNVFAAIDQLARFNVPQGLLAHREFGELSGTIYTSNTASVVPDEKIGSMVATRRYRYMPNYARNTFSADGIGRSFDIADAHNEAPLVAVSGYESNTARWDKSVFTAPLSSEGKDLHYDVVWQRMQVASAWLTRRER